MPICHGQTIIWCSARLLRHRLSKYEQLRNLRWAVAFVSLTHGCCLRTCTGTKLSPSANNLACVCPDNVSLPYHAANNPIALICCLYSTIDMNVCEREQKTKGSQSCFDYVKCLVLALWRSPHVTAPTLHNNPIF